MTRRAEAQAIQALRRIGLLQEGRHPFVFRLEVTGRGEQSRNVGRCSGPRSLLHLLEGVRLVAGAELESARSWPGSEFDSPALRTQIRSAAVVAAAEHIARLRAIATGLVPTVIVPRIAWKGKGFNDVSFMQSDVR